MTKWGGRDAMAGKRERFMAALLVCPTVKQAYEAAGMSRSGAYKALADEGFRRELGRYKAEAMRSVATYLQASAGECAEVLVGIAADEGNSPQVRINAAQAALGNARAFTDMVDVMDRLDALETKVDVKGGAPWPIVA